jgi:uncharacterized membrane protein YbhN (UPF0104 family)
VRRRWAGAGCALLAASASLPVASGVGAILALRQMERSGAGLAAISVGSLIPWVLGSIVLFGAGVACLGVAWRSPADG